MADKIFISYRRQDSDAHALNIAQYLQSALGASRVFLDVDRIRPGERFSTVLEEHLANSGHLIAVIGPSWLTIPGADGRRRIDDPTDWVRLEIERALSFNIPVIPILVGGATLPRAEDLPESLRPLLAHQAVTVTTENFRHVMPGLIRDLGLSRTGPRRTAIAAAATGLIVVAGLVGAALIWKPELMERLGAAPQPQASASNSGSGSKGRDSAPTLPKGDACAHLKAAFEQSNDDFKKLKVAELRNNAWSARWLLEGYQSCEVIAPKHTALFCKTAKLASKDAGRAWIKSAADRALACLGSNWRKAHLTDEFVGVSHPETGHSVIFAVQQDSELSPQLELVQTFVNTAMIYRARPDNAPPANMIVAEQPKGYCSSLRKVVESAGNRFKDIMGAKIRSHYATSVGLDGWFDCQILDLDANKSPPRYYYSCELSPFPNGATADKMMSAIATDVKECLGQGWSMRRRRRTDGRLNIEFANSAVAAEVELRQRTNYAKEWEIKLDINLP